MKNKWSWVSCPSWIPMANHQYLHRYQHQKPFHFFWRWLPALQCEHAVSRRHTNISLVFTCLFPSFIPGHCSWNSFWRVLLATHQSTFLLNFHCLYHFMEFHHMHLVLMYIPIFFASCSQCALPKWTVTVSFVLCSGVLWECYSLVRECAWHQNVSAYWMKEQMWSMPSQSPKEYNQVQLKLNP